MTNTLLGDIHLYSAFLATALGTMILAGKKGTTIHKKIGYAYCVSMLVVNVTALMIYRLFGYFGIFHYAAVISLITLLLGMIPIMIKKTNKNVVTHMAWMYWSVIGLYAAFISESLTRIPDKPFFTMLGIAVTITMVAGAIGFGKYIEKWKKLFTNKKTIQ